MSKTLSSQVLTETAFAEGIADLSSRDADLGAVILKWGRPPLWTHAQGFAGIVMAILAQQVSLESASAAYAKLESAIGAIEAGAFLSLDARRLREIGFSRQKGTYARDIALAISNSELDMAQLQTLSDEQAREQLMEIRGVGRWTADTYLLFSLLRPDVWPSGDLALAKSIREVKRLEQIPGFDEVDHMAAGWRPWRAVAARILWHAYLSERGR